MNLGLSVQGGLHVFPYQDEGRRSTFALERARIGLSGHLISKSFTYRVTGDGAAGMQSLQPAVPGSETASQAGAVSVPFLLDAAVRLSVPRIGLAFDFGRFVPSLGFMMAERPDRLGTLLYPLYLIGGKNALGTFRDVGLEMRLALGKAVTLGGGVFNGGFNNWVDDNDRKDLSAFFIIHPHKAFRLHASALFKFRNAEGAKDGMGRSLDNAVETRLTPCFEASYRRFGLTVIGGYAMGLTVRDDRDTREDDRAQGAFGHVGYRFLGDLLELSGRFDWWDPSVFQEEDAQYRVTVGPTLHLESAHLAVSVNYVQDIYQSEAAACEGMFDDKRCADSDTLRGISRTPSTILFQLSLSI